MGKKINFDIDKLCEEFLHEGENTYTLSKKYNCDNKTIGRRLKKYGNEQVQNKLNPKATVTVLDNKSISVVPTNSNNIFIFPIYLKEVFENSAWSEQKNGYYIEGCVYGKRIMGHHLVYGIPLDGMKYEVDHKDRNPKNNMPENLRLITRSLSNHNTVRKKTKNLDCKYRGVVKNPNNKTKESWISRIRIDGYNYHLGVYNTQEEAGLRYLDVKFNLLGYEYMSDKDKDDYNYLLTYFATMEV